MKATLLLPTLNEIEGMKAIMPRINPQWFHEIIVVDGGSTDGTWEYAASQGYKTIRQTSPYLHGAYRDAMPHVTGDIVVTFSPDGNSVPERIPDLLTKMKEGHDMVIVSRYLDGAKSADDDWVTGLGNWIFTRMINLFFGGRYTDALVIFRAWKRDLIQLCASRGNIGGIDPHLSILCAKHKMKVAEIGGDEPARIGGIRKMDPIKNGLGLFQLIAWELFS